MELSSKNAKVTTLLMELITLLKKYDELQWANHLTALLAEYNSANNSEAVIAEMKKILLGGSGSLADLVLYKDGIPPIADNNKMQDLLSAFYNTIC